VEIAQPPISLIIIAPYPSVRAGLRAMVEESREIDVLGESSDIEVGQPDTPDALLVDLDPDRLDLPGQIAARYPSAAQVLLIDSPSAMRQIDGLPERATAVLLKDATAEEIIAGIVAASLGLVVLDPTVAQMTGLSTPDRDTEELDEPLTEREHQVLDLLALGLPNKTIAMELGISEHTAKFHVASIMSKLAASSRTEAVAIAARRGILAL
jgi:DNA-binding NarL/FixJ family response regulator